jgi:fumarate hydratase subunit alpha
MSVREISVEVISRTVRDLFLEANMVLRKDVLRAIRELYDEEKAPNAKEMLKVLLENARIAREEKMAICQDTGLSVVFLEVGEDVHITGGDLNRAVDKGVESAYKDGFLRKSVVRDPLLRDNTGTNTPAEIHVDMVPGDKIKVAVFPKGFGSENKGRIAMLNPTAGEDAVVDFCVDSVKKAGPDACPPYMLGVGIGGTMESCALIAKKALLRSVDSSNPDKHIAALEKKIEQKVRELEIGVMGLGGISTVMGVNVETAPTHIAGLPVAVNISCHALRSASGII